MMNYQEMNHDKIWNYLNKLAPHLTQEQLETLSNVFQFMKQDYTLEQEFGEVNLQYVLKKEEKPYLDESLPDYTVPEEIEEEIKKMLNSFNEAKSHMETAELICIASILSIIDDDQFTMNLLEKDSQLRLVFGQKTVSNIAKYR